MAPPIKNTSDLPDELLAIIVPWVLEDRDGAAAVRSILVTNTSAAFRGFCTWSRSVAVRIGRQGEGGFPRVQKYPGLVTAPEFTVADRIEALVMVLAHETEHARQMLRRSRWEMQHNTPEKQRLTSIPRPQISEVEAERAAMRTLERFRVVRVELGIDEVPARVAEKHAALAAKRERSAALRAAKDRFEASDEAKRALLVESIAAWTKKLRRAETYLKKYKRRLAGLDRRIAAKNGVG